MIAGWAILGTVCGLQSFNQKQVVDETSIKRTATARAAAT
jgi:hypothetical protein